MTRSRIAVLALAVMGLFGCQRRESITGGYGDRVVAGQVTMAAGMPSSTPAGVRITVGMTGMSAVLDSSGNFMFVDVPEGAVLHFTRGEDGIDARLATAGTIAPLSITLSATAASVGRRRAVAPAAQEVEGLITAVSATEITIHDSHRNDVTLTINADTVIRKGGQALQATDLKIGDRVHAKANGTTALQIVLQNDGTEDDGRTGQLKEFEGLVQAISATEITINGTTLKITATTVIRKGNTTLTTSDIKVNDRVHVKADGDTALEIMLQNPADDHGPRK
jgi:hypothetical protein